MDDENRLIFIDQCLKKFEYPNIHALKMPEIYGASNRKFLLSWLYSLFQGFSMTEILPDETLCEFLNWFCKSSQVKGVLEAEIEYPVQLKILYKIFKNLDCIKRVKPEPLYDDISLRVTEELCDKDINIFKLLGPIRISDDDLISQPEVKSENLLVGHVEEIEALDISSSQLIEKLFEMKKNGDSATEIISNMLRNSTSENFHIEFDDNHMELFRQFNELIYKGKKYIANVKTISHNNEKLSSLVDDIEKIRNNDSNVTMVEELIKIIREI